VRFGDLAPGLGREPEAAVELGSRWLLGDAVRALPCVVLGGFHVSPALAAQNVDEAPHSVRLRARGGHDVRLSRAFRALR
jgi:hypothetical protein